MKKIIYDGSCKGFWAPKQYGNFLSQFKTDVIRAREDSHNYNYSIENLIDHYVVSYHKVKVRKNRNVNIRVKLSGTEENIEEFEKLILEEAKKYKK